MNKLTGYGVTMSSPSMALTFAVAGDDFPQLDVDSGSFNGTWATLIEGPNPAPEPELDFEATRNPNPNIVYPYSRLRAVQR